MLLFPQPQSHCCTPVTLLHGLVHPTPTCTDHAVRCSWSGRVEGTAAPQRRHAGRREASAVRTHITRVAVWQQHGLVRHGSERAVVLHPSDHPVPGPSLPRDVPRASARFSRVVTPNCRTRTQPPRDAVRAAPALRTLLRDVVPLRSCCAPRRGLCPCRAAGRARSRRRGRPGA